MSHWDRKLWAIEFSGPDNRFIVGTAWYQPDGPRYPGEPTRCLEFTTRAFALKCRNELRERHKLACPNWKFKVVRAREIVKEVK